MNSRYAEGVRAVAPIGIAAAAFGLSFGVLARASGMGWGAPLVMSATTFALIPFTPAGVPIIAAAAACLAGWRSR